MKRVSEHEWNIGQRFECESPADYSIVDVVLADDYDAAIRERDEARAELDAVSTSIGTNYYLDPPDGGSVTLAEQVRRMKADRDALRAAVEAHNARLRSGEGLIYVPPSAAPAASEPRKPGWYSCTGEPPLPDPFDKRYSAEAGTVSREAQCQELLKRVGLEMQGYTEFEWLVELIEEALSGKRRAEAGAGPCDHLFLNSYACARCGKPLQRNPAQPEGK